MKNKLRFLTVLLVTFLGMKSQDVDSLIVNYYENYPFAYMESGKLVGIEVDIVTEYVNWLKQKKSVNTIVSYKAFTEFSAFYTATKSGGSKVLGLGSVTSNAEREKDLLLSPAYMQNVAVLVTAGTVPTVKIKSKPEVENVLGKLSAVVVNKSSHEKYMNEIKAQFLPGLKIVTVETQTKVLERIVSDNSNFGYADIVAYWAFLKKNSGKYLKMQKIFNESKEHLSFVMPKGSVHAESINEFFESGFGFTSTKMYHQILEKYLGYEIIESVEIK